MKKNDKKYPSEFFAAQNSYAGFINHFKKTFDSSKYERIFILKGGPGTGKSSIMKKIAELFSKTANVTKIYCSSDTSSLDGVIVSKNGKRVAILDGTAPHERDAVIPGAVDELVNLGECWDSEALGLKKAEIIALNQKKSKHYAAAYELLAIAGEFKERLKRKISAHTDKISAKALADKICKNLSVGECLESNLLLSAFGKLGYQTLPHAMADTDEIIQIVGEYRSESVFMDILCEQMRNRGIRHTKYPSPLDPDETETLWVTDGKKTTVYTTLTADEKFPVKEILSADDSDRTVLELYFSECKKYEALAKEQFSLAAQSHFALEDIYTPSMNFDMINGITEALQKKIAKALE